MFVVSFALSILYYFAAKSNDRTQQFLRGNVSILPKRKGRFGPRERAPAAPLRAMPAERLFFRRGSAIMNVRRGVPRARCRRTPCGGETDPRAARVPKNMDINKYDPKFKLRRRDLLGLTDLTSEEIFELLYAAKAMKKKFRVRENSTLLRGKTVALLFGNASTRTRVSFEMGIRQMSGDYIYLSKDETQLSRGESLKDTAAMLGRYGLSAVVLRSLTETQTHEFASYSDIPVINGITEVSHPLQILSDLFTIWEVKGRLDNLKLAYIGDGNNIANSLIMGCSKVNMDVAIASPHGYSPARSVVERAMQYGDVLITDDIAAAVHDADVVYTDVFISMNEEDDEEKKHILSRYRVTPEVMALAKPDAVFMHCMPVHRGEEVAAEVVDGPQSICYDQAENRLHVNKAALALLVK